MDKSQTPASIKSLGKCELETYPMDYSTETAGLLPNTAAQGETHFYGAHNDSDTTPQLRQSRSMNHSIQPVVRQENSRSQGTFMGKKTCLVALKGILGAALFLAVLVCSAASKVTLISLAGRLGCVANTSGAGYCSNGLTSSSSNDNNKVSIRLYWYLLFIISMPNVLTFIRSTAFGVLGKTLKTFPWPKRSAVFLGLLSSAAEVTAITVVVYIVLPMLPPDIAILTLNGLFLAQIITDIYVTRNSCWDSDSLSQVYNDRKKFVSRIWYWIGKGLEHKLTKLLALVLQIGGILSLAFYCGFKINANKKIVALPLSLIVLSIVWSNRAQEYIAKAWKSSERNNTARYKSSFINSAFRIILYPLVSCGIFYGTYHVNPWSSRNIVLVSPELAELLTQILTSLLAYVFVWASCVMMLNRCGLALPLFLSTPVSLMWYYLNLFIHSKGGSAFPRFQTKYSTMFEQDIYPIAVCIATILWISQLLGMVYYIANKTNIILAKDSEMFLTPHYDGVFLEQHTLLNRQTKKNMAEQQPANRHQRDQRPRKPRDIFICSTMFRENEIEMKQMLTSIYRIAEYRRDRKLEHQVVDNFESHIFFDGSINGTQLQPFALQLIALLEGTLHVKLTECLKTETPYGYQLTWYLGLDGMRFTIHLKDKNKVKPKKRWSQVMYMNYIINHRIEESDLDPKDTFILTTDADIDFTAESAVVLLDMLASNEKVGAVSARTHPKGTGPVYWYQIFDYAIGHWFMKPAEHIFGCVLCSPGCFSVFRCKALNDAIAEYATEVTSAPEFLTKDMGEDRWLCTLLIKRGWRLEYCAISEDQTYVPDNFSEFYKQRRRWIPSTIANLGQLISEAGSITRKNDTISYLFILFQGLMVFSTAISPATVILIIATGLQSAYQIDTIASIVILVLVSVLFGIICLTASPKTQLDVAKLLTFIFAIIMAIVIVGIFRDTIFDIIPSPSPIPLNPLVDCSVFQHSGNNTNTELEKYDQCVKDSRYLASLANATGSPYFKLPVTMTTIYLGIFAGSFTTAAILHFREMYCLIHFIWYLLALPSGYLFLLIYSAANLNSQSWGTREASSKTDKGLIGWIAYIKMAWEKMYSCCRRQPKELPNIQKQGETVIHNKVPSEATDQAAELTMISHKKMDKDTELWLTELDCENYVSNFEEHGYINKHYIAAMNMKDFEAIGINKRGFRRRLEKAAKKLPSLLIDMNIPSDVERWLTDLEMEEYIDLFRSEGYKSGEDIENLKDLSKTELLAIGVQKRAHLQRLQAALNRLFYPMPIEILKRNTKAKIEKVDTLTLDAKENQFWIKLIRESLQPITDRFTQVDDLKDNLRSLRNMTLLVVLLVNIIWIILLHTLKFDQLEIFSFDPRVFQLLFITVYGFIIVIQFVAMICHRCVTLIHYLGRVKGEEIIIPDHQAILELTMRENA